MTDRLPRHQLFLLVLLVLLTAVSEVAAADSLRGLILTSPGVYHNYEYQNHALAEAIASRVDITFDISLAEKERWRSSDFSDGYDVLVYNICMADNEDTALIANMRRQSETLGVPALVLHCTMHSFRNTDRWWPLYGLETVAHAPLGSLHLDHAREHPVLAGVPADWTLAKDELYLNLSFSATPLLLSRDEDGTEHVTAWLAMAGGAPLFGTTLGHSDATIEDPVYQRLLANAVLLVTGRLGDDGEPVAGAAAIPGRDAVNTVSKPAGVEFLGEEGQDCAFSMLARAVGPCYVGCVLHPFKWGAEADACREACNLELPEMDQVIAECSPGQA